MPSPARRRSRRLPTSSLLASRRSWGLPLATPPLLQDQAVPPSSARVPTPTSTTVAKPYRRQHRWQSMTVPSLPQALPPARRRTGLAPASSLLTSRPSWGLPLATPPLLQDLAVPPSSARVPTTRSISGSRRQHP